ncbi:MAG: hypothetical protein M3Z64_07205 [Verrucomicrobiota bacterium]|nr:hypothetical protein [Verrucomicrobiota bacterium]
MGREIKLNGGEITLLKTIGLTGTQVSGKQVVERVQEMETAEFLDTLDGLIAMGYVLANKVNVRLIEDVERSILRVNPAYTRDLRDAISPSKRRDQDRTGRDRRR